MKNMDDFTNSEFIRKRPGMFIGSVNFLGFKNMFGSWLDDIAKNNLSNLTIEIEYHQENHFKLKVSEIEVKTLLESIYSLNTINHNLLNGFGLAVIICLNQKVNVSIKNELYSVNVIANKGELSIHENFSQSNQVDLEIEFEVDLELFPSIIINYFELDKLFEKYSMIYPNLKIITTYFIGEKKVKNTFHNPNGTKHWLDFIINDNLVSKPVFRVDCNAIIDEYTYQISLAFCDTELQENKFLITYANSNELFLGGSLLQGVLDGVSKALKVLANQHNSSSIINYNTIKKHLILVAVFKGSNFEYNSATRSRIGMPNIRRASKNFIHQQLLHNLIDKEALIRELLSKF